MNSYILTTTYFLSTIEDLPRAYRVYETRVQEVNQHPDIRIHLRSTYPTDSYESEILETLMEQYIAENPELENAQVGLYRLDTVSEVNLGEERINIDNPVLDFLMTGLIMDEEYSPKDKFPSWVSLSKLEVEAKNP